MKKVIFCIFYHCIPHPSELWSNFFSFPLLPMSLQMSFLQSLTLHTKFNFTPSQLGMVSVFLLSDTSQMSSSVNFFFTSQPSHEFPVQPTFCYSCSTFAYQNGPFLCTYEGVQEDQICFLCPSTLQRASHGISTNGSLENLQLF